MKNSGSSKASFLVWFHPEFSTINATFRNVMTSFKEMRLFTVNNFFEQTQLNKVILFGYVYVYVFRFKAFLHWGNYGQFIRMLHDRIL